MSAKILKALSEDPQQLEKEIGCMTGMLQIFDRQNAITGRRFGHRRLSGGELRSVAAMLWESLARLGSASCVKPG